MSTLNIRNFNHRPCLGILVGDGNHVTSNPGGPFWSVIGANSKRALGSMSQDGKIISWWRRIRARRWLALAMDVALIVVAMLLVHAWQARSLPIDEPAPQAMLERLQGGANHVVPGTGEAGVVYFFAPWCHICENSIGSLDALVESGSIAWAHSVALDYAEEASVQAFVQRTGITMPVLLGGQQQVESWGIRAFPTYFVIDGEGRIASRSVGYSTSLGLRARVWLAK